MASLWFIAVISGEFALELNIDRISKLMYVLEAVLIFQVDCSDRVDGLGKVHWLAEIILSMRYGTENEYLGMVAQAGSYKILMYMLYVSPRGKEVHIFYRKKIPTSEFVYPKRIPMFMAYPRKKIPHQQCAGEKYNTQKNPWFFFVIQKNPHVFHRPKKIPFGQNFRPQKIPRRSPRLPPVCQ